MTERSRDKSREIIERIVIEGKLGLTRSTHLGNGDVDELIDMPLLLNNEGQPLLTGTSIAGALRNYLREWMLGYLVKDDPKMKDPSLATHLFGGTREDENGAQSSLIVDDARGVMQGIELRDGVKIDPGTRTAEDQKKFDIELLEAGTTFELRFELLISRDSEDKTKRLLCALALALRGLEREEIALGKRKSRGYGRCRVSEWAVTRYDLSQENDLLAWLASERDWKQERTVKPKPEEGIASLLGVEPELKAEDYQDHRKFFKLNAEFELEGSLLIRSGAGPEQGPLPDDIHLHSKQAGTANRQPILPGTSVAGVLRHRALRIGQTIAGQNGKARKLVEEMFGTEPKGEDDTTLLKASRLIVEETPICGGHLLVQNRIRIDRFTGGVYDGALFNEGAIFGGPGSRVCIELKLKNPKDYEIGLLLLLLKDLWTQDLPLGGESSIGRGRLKGEKAKLELKCGDHQHQQWELSQDKDGLSLVDEKTREQLENFVNALQKRLSLDEAEGET